LNPSKFIDNQARENSLKVESEIEIESEIKAIPTKNNENSKVLFEDWPEGEIMNLDD